MRPERLLLTLLQQARPIVGTMALYNLVCLLNCRRLPHTA
jgi:hypothetical protein